MRNTYQAFMHEIKPSEKFCVTLERDMKRALYDSKHRNNHHFEVIAVVTVLIMFAVCYPLLKRPDIEDHIMQPKLVVAENVLEASNNDVSLLPAETAKKTPAEAFETENDSNGDVWIDTSTEALLEAEDSIAIQMLKEDYSDERSYICVNAVIHFTANQKDYELYHVLDTGGGAFTLSTTGVEPYPYVIFGGEDSAEAREYFEAENRAKRAYFSFYESTASIDDS